MYLIRGFFTAWDYQGGAAMMNAIVVLSFIGVFVGKCYYYSKYSHKR